MAVGNILISSDFGSRSHILFILEITKVLRDRGYDITLATTKEHIRYANGYNVSLFDLGSFPDYQSRLQRANDAAFLPSKKIDKFHIMNEFYSQVFPRFYKLSFIGLERYFDKSGLPDLMICDLFALACIDVAHKHNIPLIIGSQGADFIVGFTSPLLTQGDNLFPLTTDQITLWEKVYNKLIVSKLKGFGENKLDKQVGLVRAQFNITNVHSFFNLDDALVLLDSNYGFFPSVDIPSWSRLIGPILPESHAPLDNDTAIFLNSKQSIMYISFGSDLRIAPFDIENILLASLQAFDSGDLDGIIWSLGILNLNQFPPTLYYNNILYKTPNLLELYKHHIHFVKWTSQMGVLRHNSTKIFLTHGGMTSIHESFLASKPTLCYPLAADQPRNAYRLYEIGIGLFVDRYQTHYTKIFKQIQTLIKDQNQTFRANIDRMRAINQLNNPTQLYNKKVYAADLVESYLQTALVCRPNLSPSCELHHITPVNRNMSYFAAHNIDLLLIQSGFWVLLITIGLFLVKLIVSRIWFHSLIEPTKVKKT